jgi:hypothetical protein
MGGWRIFCFWAWSGEGLRRVEEIMSDFVKGVRD